ncbi:hypoxia-inducible factor 1-alpha-like isoform X1 [Diadema antillarum]|uniref:hypoxia-inducible factor 1-alpha-like isoform X1 n=1 Tax=Diadema antillarum TaxID=105358 RepID=UPI003A87CA7C
MATVPREKRRNSEKRKEKSRNAARCRRGKETEIFYELAHTLPLAHNVCAQLDKAGIMRLVLSFLKIGKILPKEIKVEEKEDSKVKALDQIMDPHYQKSLDGFLLILSQEGDMVFISESVSKFVGINQVDLMGHSIYDYTHPCDHDEIREQLSDRPGLSQNIPSSSSTLLSSSSERQHHSFLIRMKCTLTPKGKIVNLKAATYKVIHCQGHMKLSVSEAAAMGYRIPSSPCLVLIASPIPHPSNIEIPLDCSAFLTRHSMDMKFTYCDEKIEELMGYKPNELVGKSFYDYYHALDGQLIDKSHRDLFAKGQTSTGRYRFLAKSGGYMWLETQATIIYNNKTNKPQCIVCVNYTISGVEAKGEVLSVDQQDQEIKDVEMTEEKIFVPRPPHINNDFPLYLAGCNCSSQAVEEKLAYLAPTAGDVMIELDPNDSQRMELCDFKGIGDSDSFVPFDPFAPLPDQEEEKTYQQNNVQVEPAIPAQDPSVMKNSFMCTNNDPLMMDGNRGTMAREKDKNTELVTQQMTPDELAMRAPYIPMGEDFDLSCDSLLGEMDDLTSDTWMPVDPFGTAIDKTMNSPASSAVDYLSPSQASSCGTSPFSPSLTPGMEGSSPPTPMTRCSSLSGSMPSLCFPNSAPPTPQPPLLQSPLMSPHNPSLMSPCSHSSEHQLFASPNPSPAPPTQALGLVIPHQNMLINPPMMSPPLQGCQPALLSPPLKRKQEPPDCGDYLPRRKLACRDGVMLIPKMKTGIEAERMIAVKKEPELEKNKYFAVNDAYRDTRTQGGGSSMDLLTALLQRVDKEDVNPFIHSQYLQQMAQKVIATNTNSGNTSFQTSQPPATAEGSDQQSGMQRKRSITQLLGRDGLSLDAALPLINNMDAEVNAPLQNTYGLLQGEALLQALDPTMATY